jgi:hypothetical protein
LYEHRPRGRRRTDSGYIDRQATRAAEVFEVLSARCDHRIVRRKRRGRNRGRPAVERLGIARSSGFLSDDGEVIQRARQIRMQRTQLSFLNACGMSQQLIRRREVASGRGMFRHLEHVLNVR